MFPNSKVVKKNALAALRGNWATALSVILIWVLFIFSLIVAFSIIGILIKSAIILTVVGILFLVIAIFGGMPLSFGVIKFLWHLSDKNDASIDDVFYYFSSKKTYLKAFNLTFQILSKFLCVGSILIVPSIVMGYIADGGLKDVFAIKPAWITNFWIVAVFLRALGIMLTIIFTAKYYLAPFIFVINDEIEPLEAMHLSKKAAKVSIWNFVGLICTLIGWVLLSLLGVTIFFTLPYFAMCYVIHSRFAVYYYNEWVKSLPDSFFQV